MGCINRSKVNNKKIFLVSVLILLFAGLWIFIPLHETSGNTISPPIHVVISEIQAMGEEYIELYNPTEEPQFIESWQLCIYSASDYLEYPPITRTFPD